VLHAYDGQLKSASFLPLYEAGGAYAQMPFERVDEDAFAGLRGLVGLLSLESLYDGSLGDAAGEKYCSNDTCELPQA
jgi:hypothetical protein